MQKILLISGCKQSGKTSAMNYLAGYLLKQSGLEVNGKPITSFQLDENGELEIPQEFTNPETGEVTQEWAKLDISRRDTEFSRTASRYIWPIIRSDSFAEYLKEIAIVIFGLKREEVYGTDEQKNRFCGIKWENVYKLLPELRPKKRTKKELLLNPELENEVQPEYLTNREFLEVLGTDVVRALYDEAWIQSLYQKVVESNYPFVAITDCRFELEITYGKQLDGVDVRVVRLLRNPFEGQHTAETNLLNYEGFDAVIDNREITQEQKGVELINILRGWGWVS
jgi:hypothetical protein